MSRDFAGIVLAGGRSRRMGRDKAMLLLDGETLLDRAIATLRAAGAVEVRVSGDRPSHDGLPDAQPEMGPVGGLASVLAHCADGVALAVAVDQPRLDAGTLRRLLDALEGAPAAAYAGHPLPLALRVDAVSRETVATAVRASPRGPSIRDLHRALGGVELPPPPGDALFNANTPDDWAEVES
ncbi:molybdenum cofactor guanylyltransferase [Lysobacter xanthus]